MFKIAKMRTLKERPTEEYEITASEAVVSAVSSSVLFSVVCGVSVLAFWGVSVPPHPTNKETAMAAHKIVLKNFFFIFFFLLSSF